MWNSEVVWCNNCVSLSRHPEILVMKSVKLQIHALLYSVDFDII